MKLPGPGYRLWLVLLFLAFLPIATGQDEYRVSVLSGAILLGLLGQAWSLMARCGLISLGHAAFFGIGAYGAAVSRTSGFPLIPSLAFGGALALIFSMTFVGLAGRLKGAYFALATLVLAAVPKAVVMNWRSVTGGSEGLFGLPSLGAITILGMEMDPARNRLIEYYMIFFAVFLLASVIWWLVHRSRFGMASSALRIDETAARSLGISPTRYKATAIMASALFTGIGGGLYAFQVRYMEPNYLFSLHFSAIPLVVAIFGGMSTTWGPLIGALILHTLDEFVFRRFFMTSHEILYGLTLTAAILLFPRGIFKAIMKMVGEERIAYR